MKQNILDLGKHLDSKSDCSKKTVIYDRISPMGKIFNDLSILVN